MLHFHLTNKALSMNGMYNAAQIGQYNSTNPNGGRGVVCGVRFVQQGDNRGEDVVNLQVSLTYQSNYDQVQQTILITGLTVIV
jgi:hypothetical protein